MKMSLDAAELPIPYHGPAPTPDRVSARVEGVEAWLSLADLIVASNIHKIEAIGINGKPNFYTPRRINIKPPNYQYVVIDLSDEQPYRTRSYEPLTVGCEVVIGIRSLADIGELDPALPYPFLHEPLLAYLNAWLDARQIAHPDNRSRAVELAPLIDYALIHQQDHSYQLEGTIYCRCVEIDKG